MARLAPSRFQKTNLLRAIRKPHRPAESVAADVPQGVRERHAAAKSPNYGCHGWLYCAVARGSDVCRSPTCLQARPGGTRTRVRDSRSPSPSAVTMAACSPVALPPWRMARRGSWSTASGSTALGAPAVRVFVAAHPAEGTRWPWRRTGLAIGASMGCRRRTWTAASTSTWESSALTNALPVHRLRLEVGARKSAPAAYVRAHGLRVERLEQDYTRISDDGQHQRYHYTAPALDFSC